MRSLLITAALFVCALSATAASPNRQPGSLSSNFGTAGEVTADFGMQSAAGSSAAITPDGHIVVGGTTWDSTGLAGFALAQYSSNNGRLDKKFGTNGRAVLSLSDGSLVGNSVAVQPDGKVLIAGSFFFNGAQEFAVARFTSTGASDSAFAFSGIFFEDVTGAGAPNVARKVLVESDGKIVLAGYAMVNGALHFALLRLNADGTVDSTFGSNGVVTTDFNSQWGGTSSDEAFDALQDASGHLVVAGYSSANGASDFAVARYSATGALDTTFGNAGLRLVAFSGNDSVSGIGAGPNASIVLGGSCGTSFCLARLTNDGTPDATFANGAKAVFAQSSAAHGLAVQSDGKLLLAGETNTSGGSAFALARFNADGSTDTAFGSSGTVVTAFADGASVARGVAVQSKGYIVAAGAAGRVFAVARYVQ